MKQGIIKDISSNRVNNWATTSNIHWESTGNFGQAVGTSLQGYISAKFSTLGFTFGKPTEIENAYEGDQKVDVTWVITFSDNEVATIYNYKNGKNYLGNEGQNVTSMTEWNVGGTSPQVVKRVAMLIGLQSESVNIPSYMRSK